MAQNPKGFAAFAILCLLLVYGVAYVLRRRTPYKGSCAEGCLVTLILVVAFIVVPAFISADVMAIRARYR